VGIYVGMKEKAKAEIFEFEMTPTKETHPQYDFTCGPFKTFEDANKYVNAMNRGVACSEG
jgi:hypothetical protein